VILGCLRDHLARVRLTLPGLDGDFEVEFIVDTGFEGELALPGNLARRLDANGFVNRYVRLADGSEQACPHSEITLDWDNEPRLTEVVVLEGNPLLGMLLIDGSSLHVDAVEGGDVVIELL